MRISIAADHNGVALKAHLTEWLTARGDTVEDRGAYDAEVVDYPRLCEDVCRQVLDGRADRAIMIGGSGSGEQVACNKIRGIRAGLCHDEFTAEISAGHNNANVLILGAKMSTPTMAERIVERWLTTPFKGGRHQERLDQIAVLERGESLL
ncbi:MAG: ribose 5-phosphate isomerase B [Egibacteraceae bacterium]